MIDLSYGTARADTEQVCGIGNLATGFGATFYWGNFGEGAQEVVLYADGVEQARNSFFVVMPEEGFLNGVTSECLLNDFPDDGGDAKIEWSEADQSFIVVEYN